MATIRNMRAVIEGQEITATFKEGGYLLHFDAVPDEHEWDISFSVYDRGEIILANTRKGSARMTEVTDPADGPNV